MIIDRIANFHLYTNISERLKTVAEYVKQTDLSAMPSGKYELDGKNCFVLLQEYETKPQEQGKWENHREYIDVQYLVRGEEQIGYADVNLLTPVTEHDPEKDIRFYSGNGSFLTLRKGTFTVFFPDDAHMPGIALHTPERVKKAVAKIRVF